MYDHVQFQQCARKIIFAIKQLFSQFGLRPHYGAVLFILFQQRNEIKKMFLVPLIVSLNPRKTSEALLQVGALLSYLFVSIRIAKRFTKMRKRERTHVLLVNTPCLHLHKFRPNSLSRALVTSNQWRHWKCLLYLVRSYFGIISYSGARQFCWVTFNFVHNISHYFMLM
jgi:hypothetical protein